MLPIYHSVNAFGQINEIDGLIDMSAYPSFEDVVIDNMDRIGFPKFIQIIEKPIITASFKLIYGSNSVENLIPMVQIKNAGDRPVLLVALEVYTLRRINYTITSCTLPSSIRGILFPIILLPSRSNSSVFNTPLLLLSIRIL